MTPRLGGLAIGIAALCWLTPLSPCFAGGAATRLKPGQYEVAMTYAGQASIRHQCFTAEQVNRDARDLLAHMNQSMSRCKNTQFSEDGAGGVRGSWECPDQKMSTQVWLDSDVAYRTTTTVDMRNGQHIVVNEKGHRIGDCAANEPPVKFLAK